MGRELKRRVFYLLITCVLWGCSPSAVKSPSSAQQGTGLTAEQMREDLRQYRDAVLQSWAYLELKQSTQDVDVSRTCDQLLARITDDTTPQQFASLLREFAASLHDGHSEVLLRNIEEPLPYSWPIGLMLVREGIIVSSLNWLTDNPGVELGDRLIQVDGTPIDEYVTSRMAITSASTVDAQRVLTVDRLHWSSEPSVKLTFEKADASVFEAVFPCLPERIDFRFRKSEVFCTHSIRDDRIAYIRIPSFDWNSEAFAAASTDSERDQALIGAKSQIDESFAAAADASGIILDLRNNGGGLDLLSIYVAQHLVPGNFIYYETERRDSPLLRSLPRYHDMDARAFGTRLPQQPRNWTGFTHFSGQPFAGPLVVLINERCFSSTDNLCAFLRDVRPRTTFVGRPTNGGTGEPVVVDTLSHSGANIQFCVSRVFSPMGRAIEGEGTKPDVQVDIDREGALKGHDADIDVALKLLASE